MSRRVPATVPAAASYGTYNPATSGGRSVAPASYQTRGPALAREFFPDRGLQRIQTASLQAMQTAKGNPFADGNLFRGLSFIAGASQTLSHGLGRAYQGAFVVAITSGNNGGMVRVTAPTVPALVNTQIILFPIETFTGDVWVY